MKESGSLGVTYNDGETIVEQGNWHEEFLVVEEGKIEITRNVDGEEILLAVCGQGEIIGDWSAEFSNDYSVNVRAKGKTRVITVHRRTLMRRMHEDPTLAFRMLEMMFKRVLAMNERVIEMHQRLKTSQSN